MIERDHNIAARLCGTIAIVLLAFAACLLPAERAAAQPLPATCNDELAGVDLIDHDLNDSNCELCGTGRVEIVVENPTRSPDRTDFSNIVVEEDLRSSGLTYAGNLSFAGSNVAVPAPTVQVLGGNNQRVRFTFPGSFTLDGRTGGPSTPRRMVIGFDVEREASFDEEGLLTADRRIEATLVVDPDCAPGQSYGTSTGLDDLPFEEPELIVRKRGRNLDHAQTSWRRPVYAHAGDDVIWRIQVVNNGDAPLYDFKFSDSIVPGNFDITHVCDTNAGAVQAANTGSGPSCVAPPGAHPLTDITDFSPRASFGGGAPNYVVAPANGSNNFYIVGKVISSCTDHNNRVYDVEWGCESDPPLGGIDEAASGAGPFSEIAGLVTDSNPADLDVQVNLTGVNTGQNMGARGLVTIRIENTTRGTISGGAAPIELWNQLPPEYVIDPTFTPTISVNPEFNNPYPGMVNQVTWANPEPGSFPHDPGNQVAPLQNGNLRFLLSSNSTQVEAGYPDRNHVIRHGDVVTITFRTVLIDPTYFDPTANIDVRTEAPDSDPLNTDPDPDFDITDSGRIEFYELCNAGTLRTVNFSQDDIAEPEDLDVDIVGTELLFILTDQPDPLTLTASLTNRGGHDATDYELYVTFGQAMQVQTVPQGCALATGPTNYPTWWEDPNDFPINPTIYVCNREPVGPGQTEVFPFEVIKNNSPPFEDDLTFRADVVGKILLSNDVPLNFPAPVARTDGLLDVSNDYSVDAIRARVVGYNLTKAQVGTCTENLAAAGTPDDEVEIGEECNYRIRSGGWFGFDTPGFTYIAVQNVRVDDLNPDGQGFISTTDPDAESSDQILGVSFLPPPTPLTEAPFYWTFNTNVPAQRIDRLDEWFEVDFKTRVLNDPLDTSAPPNEHEAISSNILTSTFDAVFENPLTGLEEIFSLGPNTVGYPQEVHRRVDLTVTEPRLTLVKEVCNETLDVPGPGCSPFLPFVDTGDAFDTYIYRIAVTNENPNPADPLDRAPAYDVTVTNVTDASDLLYVDPLDGDGINNDADVDVDAADLNGEGTITENTTQLNGPADVIFSYTNTDALLKIDHGETVYLYYRVDPDDDVAPQQQLTSTVTASYDSLEGDSGAQDAPQGANGEAGGARQYVSAQAEAIIEIIPVEVSPKEITRTASSPLVAPPTEQPVSIGEEIEFQLRALIPVAQLRSFVIRDVLPTGLSCSEAPDVDLGPGGPYAAARFDPGGSFTPTCTDTEVIWDFGDQTVRESNRTDRRFDFAVQFIARVDNIDTNLDGLSIENGGTATETTVNYVNQAGGAVSLPLESATVQIGEPAIALTKAFSVAQVDALDIPRVTVTARNDGSATAYNLRVLDDLSAGEMSYAGAIGGANPPTVDVTTLGPDRPIFSWSPDLPIAPGETISFSFAVQVGAVPEPHQILANTIQADWTSLPGQTTALNSTGLIGADGSPTGMRIGALPNVVAPPLNDYQAEAVATMVVPPPTLAKLDLDPALAPEIGVHKPFEVTVALPEGMTQNVVVTDALDGGAVSYVLSNNADYDITYDFQGIASINGVAPSEAAFLSFPADGTSGSAVWNVGEVVTLAEDDLATNALSPSIRITYAARVNNDLVTDAGDTLQNGATGNYTNGETAATETLVDGTAAIIAVEPVVTATKLLENVTPGKASGDNPAYDDILRYTITVVNNGTAIAHDVNVTDNLPPELTLHMPFTPTAEIGPGFVPGFVPTPNGAPDGPLQWGRGNSDLSLDIPAGGSLTLIYQVRVRTPIIDPTVLENRVWVDWTSLDATSAYERTGDGCPTITAPNDYCFGPAVATGTAEPVAEPDAASKANTQPTAAVGEVFSYTITIPEAPYAFPIYDVRVHDDLTTSAADMRFVGVTRVAGLAAWTPVNTGTPTNIIIEDTTTGIDIPAGDQIVIEISVVLQDNPSVNTIGLPFTNTASYIYNWVDGDDASQRPGLPSTTPPMTIVGPDTVVMRKNGPGQLVIGVAQPFTLDLQNTGSGTAWNASITDRLPDSATGGTCDTPPTLLNVQVFDSTGGVAVSAPLVQGTGYDFSFVGPPTCEFTLSLLSSDGAIAPTQRLIVTYEAELDADTQDGIALMNVAGATSWYSAEGADRHEYTGVVTTGTVGTDDSQDAHTTTSALPAYYFEKTVTNVSTGQSPALQARPGETLRYRLYVENLSTVPMANFSLRDEIDALNAGATFVPDSLQLVLPLPSSADGTNTDATAGLYGTGIVDVRNLSLPGLNDSLEIEFDVTLASVLPAGSYATNQSQLLIGGVPFAWSDDPGVNGQADPMVPGDEDPTRVLIESMPDFLVQKVSADVTGDPAVLLAGETLEYTITVKNVGSDNAVDATLRDQIPVNTTYLPNSTTLNGVAVPDGVGGLAPLAGGILISAPEDPTPGAMRADASATQANVATIVFSVVVASDVADGTVISNQGYVSAVTGGVVDQPSDDPATPVPDDPTRNVVGNLPLLFASKDVVIETDGGTINVVDPGDVLRYTITIRNSGAIPATNVVLSDALPANTIYFPDSVTINGTPMADPVAGVSPLVAGIPVSSADLPPPAAGMGTITQGQSAVVTFALTVAPLTPVGTIISNQALVTSGEVPNLLTDGDGNPATGPEPTVVVVGDGQQLSITKTVSVVGGGAALPGSVLEYVVQVRNIATVPADYVVITDDLNVPVVGQLAYVNGSATLNGDPAAVVPSGQLLTADYSTTNGPLQPGETLVLRFQAVMDAGLALGTTVTNTGVVSWNNPPQTASASVSLDVGGMPGVGVLSGNAWHDSNFDLLTDVGETLLQGWLVDLLRNDVVIYTATVAADGSYSMGGIAPNDLNGDRYDLRFRAPDAGASTGSLGRAQSPFTNGPQQITDIIVTSGSNLLGMNLPITPNGVVYDSIERIPVAGAVLELLNASTSAPLPTDCFDDPLQQGQLTGSDGFYKFDLNFSDPGSCSSGASYLIAITGAGPNHSAGFSQIIPPENTAATTPLSVPACPTSVDDAIPATSQYCEVQGSAAAPPVSVPPRTAGTVFYSHLVLDNSQAPGSSQIFNNHLAMDPGLDSAVSISKTTPSVNVVLGQLVPYEISVGNELATPLTDLEIVDNFPAGFRYIEGSARLDGVPFEPQLDGRVLTWSGIDIDPSERLSLRLLLAVGAGVGEGEFTNLAQVLSGVGAVALSGEASATVRVVPDPDFACTDVLGRVFDDGNRNGYQDDGELGLQGIRLVTPRGLVATTDQHGRYHITCAIVPREGRGSNFVLKLDDRTLPSGYRLSTRQTQVQRATRGKALYIDYGASIHRVVGLDLADAAFEPGDTVLRPHWRERLNPLLEELQKAPATLRLSYIADVEDSKLVDARLEAVKREVGDAWKELDAYPLEIEPEIFWRHGEPGLGARLPHFGRWLKTLNPIAGPPRVSDSGVGHNVEQHLSSEEPLTEWSQDPELLKRQAGDKLEAQEVLTEQAETVKLKDVVPAIRFESGTADISPSYIQQLRRKLNEMQDLPNVRLHFVGHADDQPLSGALARRYGDNEGLSRERAGEVAEFVQKALDLPPEAISFSWAGEAEPLASNATAEGRALNRRVEVEVWYDEIGEKVALEDVVVAEDIKRVKVCRVETVCKMRFIEGHERRARLKNLVPPLHLQEGQVGVPPEYAGQIEQALFNLRDKQNLTVKFVGFTDDAPLEGRTGRIYGTHLSLSKAQARRVALAIKEKLQLSSASVASDGHGAERPIASNQTANGRSLNRRIEVEFWYDDPLQELPDEPQLCPDAASDSMLTKVYDPPWGRLPAVPIEGGEAEIPEGFTESLRRAMADVVDKTNVRLRFVGYTSNERLDRRTSMVYGDDIGLSAARARRTMENIQTQLGLVDSQVEHEGRGYVHSNDVVNAGFIQGDTSHVIAEVVYDEPAVLEDYEGVEITQLTRELEPRDPLALNLMRITVDGEPIDDPSRSSQDVQRCTDVALEGADIEFRFDGLEAQPRLSVTSSAASVAVPGESASEAGAVASSLRFRMYTNYSHYIERAEVRVFDQAESVQAEPLAVLEVGPDGVAEWQPEDLRALAPVRTLQFVLRAYGAKGRFDETAPQSLWMVPGASASAAADEAGALEEIADGDAAEADAATEPALPRLAPMTNEDGLLASYGETGPLIRNIDLGSAGTVRVQGAGVPTDHTVWLAGEPVPVGEAGEFVAETLLPKGMHTVEVSVLDEEGNGDLFLRDLDFDTSEWFYVAMADLTISGGTGTGSPEALQGANAPYDSDSIADGRLAFFLTGKFGDDWRLTASADTREGEIENLFDNFFDKSPGALFRRIDPDYHYPTFGDDGVVDQMAPTSGKLYVKLDRKESHALWGNFNVGYVDNEVARVERGLYGANAHYQTESTTAFGEKRVALDGFAADPGTIRSREEFLGTGGSLYYLKHRDLLVGSERLLIQVRDKASGLVTSVVQLDRDNDYDIDYFQGRILLSEPIAAIVADQLLVRSESLSGNQAWLVVQYEYAPGFDDLDTLAAGGAGHVWLNDFFKLGFTAYSNEEDGVDTGLYGADLVARMSAVSWLKFQGGFSQGLVSESHSSRDGGFDFDASAPLSTIDDEAGAFRVDGTLGFSDILDGTRGQLSFYYQRLYAGYSAPGLNALSDTDNYGGSIDMPLWDRLNVAFKADRLVETEGLTSDAQEADVSFAWTEELKLSAGVRNEDREDNSPVVPVTQEQGARTDMVVQAAYDPGGKWDGYVFGQASLRKTGQREANNRGGIGGSYRFNERLLIDGEVSYGDSGPGILLGTNFQQSDRTTRYLNYSLDNERGTDGGHSRRGSLVSGARTRLSESASVYMEDRYQHAKTANGLSRAVGLDWAPDERWSLGVDWEYGTLVDGRTDAKTNRNAGGGRVSYHFDKLQVSSGIEYRADETEQLDGSWTERTTWLFRNNLRLQLTPDWRMVGKFNYSFSDSSQGEFFDGGYTEAVFGYAYRPVKHDRLNVLAKYTYFFNRPTTDVVGQDENTVDVLQRSHILSLDASYDLTKTLTLGGKYAYRLGEVSLSRENPEYFDNSAHLITARGDWRFLKDWETTLEGRMLLMPALNESKGGAVIMLYRYLGKNLKVGIGYNFTDFSDDMTDLSYDHHGFFFNLIGTL